MTTRKDTPNGREPEARVDGIAEDEVYIVRIYRKNMHDKELLVGTIEDIARNHRESFKSRKELLELLSGGSK